MSDAADLVVAQLQEKGLFITSVESCTGGGFINALTHVEGVSAVLDRAWVTYSTESKFALGVSASIVEKYSVYSIETAVAMAQAGTTLARSDIAVGITGQLSFADPSFLNCVFVAVVFDDRTLSAGVTFPVGYTRPQAKIDVIEKALEMVLVALAESP